MVRQGFDGAFSPRMSRFVLILAVPLRCVYLPACRVQEVTIPFTSTLALEQARADGCGWRAQKFVGPAGGRQQPRKVDCLHCAAAYAPPHCLLAWVAPLPLKLCSTHLHWRAVLLLPKANWVFHMHIMVPSMVCLC